MSENDHYHLNQTSTFTYPHIETTIETAPGQEQKQENYQLKQKDERSSDNQDEKHNLSDEQFQTVKNQTKNLNKTSPRYFFNYMRYFYQNQFQQVAGHHLNSQQFNIHQKQQNSIKNNSNWSLKEDLFQNSLNQFTTLKLKFTQPIEKAILETNIFQKHFQFTSQLKILELKHSRYYEVVTVKVHLLFYTLKIEILNQNQESFIHDKNIKHGSGSFGDIYLLKHQHQEYAIKCLPFQQKNNKTNRQNIYKIDFLKNTLKQFFFLKLFQTLKIGPKLNKIYGFDLVMFSECVQFSMQVCHRKFIQQKDIKQLKEKLKKMHLLNIVHRDIKPQNIMYSTSFQDFVFIDFGGTLVLKEPIGYKSFSKFFGTTGYFAQQMRKILFQNQGAIDLYYNDLYGFHESISQITNNFTASFTHFDKQLSIFQYSAYNQINQYFYTYQLMGDLYHKKFDEFLHRWDYQSTDSFIQNSVYQEKIISFFTELDTYVRTSEVFIKIFNRQSVNIKYLQLLTVFKNRVNCSIFDLITFSWKQNQFQNQRILYQAIQINQSTKTNQQKNIQIILLKKQNILSFIEVNFTALQVQQFYHFDPFPIYDNFELYSYVILSYCTLSANIYSTNIIQKLKIVQKYFERVKKLQIYQIKDFQLIFICPFQNLKKLAQFFQFIALKIWKSMSQILKNKALKMIMISLLLLGYPIKIRKAKFYLQCNFISIQQPKQDKLLFYWQIYLIILSYGRIFTNYKESDFFLEISEQKLIQMESQEIKLLQFINVSKDTNKQKSKLYLLNKQLYFQIVANFPNFTEQMYDKLNKLLLNLNQNDLEVSKQYFQQWKYYIQLILAIKFGPKINSVKNKLQYILEVQKSDTDKKQMRFYNLAYILIHNHVQIIPIFTNFTSKFNQIVNCSQINTRFCLFQKIQLAQKKQQWNQYSNLTHLMIKLMTNYDENYLNYLFIILKTVKRLSKLFLQKFEYEKIESFIDFKLFFILIQKIIQFMLFYLDKGFKITKQRFNTSISRQLKFFIKDSYQRVKFQIQKSNKNSCSIQQELNQRNDIEASIKKDEKLIFMFLQFFKDLKISVIHMKDIMAHLLQKQINCSSRYSLVEYIQQSLQQKRQNSQQTFNLNNFSLTGYFKKYLEQVHKWSDNKLQQIIQSQTFKYIISHGTKQNIFYLKMEVNQFKNNFNNHQRIIILVDSIYGPLKADRFSNQILTNLPNSQISFNYFVSKIQQSNHSIETEKQLIKFYKITKNIDSFQNFYVFNELNYYIFKALLITDMALQQFYQLFLFLTKLLQKYAFKQYVKIFNSSFQDIFINTSNDTQTIKKINKTNITLISVIQYIASKIQTKDIKQNFYLALVYIYCLKNEKVLEKILRKMLVTIHNSLEYLSKYAKQKVLQNIFNYRLKQLQLIQKRFNIQRCQRKRKYLSIKSLKNNCNKYTIQDVVQIHLKNSNFQPYFQNRSICMFIRSKLQRFYQTKINYRIDYKF